MENLKEKLIDIDYSDCGACCFCLNSIGGEDESGKIVVGMDG